MKKFLAICLYVIWGCILTLGITFGGDIAREMILSLRKYADAAAHRVNITDVTVDLDLNESFVVEKYFFPKYTAMGDIEGDPGLKFENLDTEVIKYLSTESGYFCGARTDEEKTSGRIRITSKYDLDFEKIITVHFEKKYPQEFEARYMVKSSGAVVRNAYVGIPIHTYMQVKTEEVYSEKDYEIVYDSEYFKLVDKDTLIPIKATPEGEEISLKCVYGNGASGETKAFVINPAPDTQEFDEVRLSGQSAEGYEVKSSSSFSISLYNQGKKVITDYEVIVENPEAVKLTSLDYIYFTEAGKQSFTIRLPNGFSKTVTVNVYNVMSFPTVSGVELNADGAVECIEGETVKFLCDFSEGVTYKTLSFEYDQDMLTITRTTAGFNVKGKKAGEATFKVILDDGVQHFEETYSVKVYADKSLLTYIKNNSANLVSKGIGHMGGFFVLALFTVNMLRFFKVKGGFKRILFCSVCGGVFAFLTEIIQLFIPLRSATLVDIFIDMSGFYLGILILLPFVLKPKRRRKTL